METIITDFNKPYQSARSEETFFIGNEQTAVSITNPNSYLTAKVVLSSDGLFHYMKENQANYDLLFNQLAEASRKAYVAMSVGTEIWY